MEFIGWITVIKIMLQVVKRLKKIVIKKEDIKDCNKEDCGN